MELTHASDSEEALRQLAGEAAHDLNNLLGVILNYTSFVSEEIVETAAGGAAPDWAAVIGDLAQVQLAANRATVLTHRLVALADGGVEGSTSGLGTVSPSGGG